MYEFQLSFTLYRVIGLPRTAANDSIAVRYAELSDYLAVVTDRQTFIEMTAEETYGCRQDMTIVCPINRDIEKKYTESLRPGDFRGGVSEECTTTTTPWTGQVKMYQYVKPILSLTYNFICPECKFKGGKCVRIFLFGFDFCY